ncbi:MAG: hypothetical protein AAB037_00800, partial [Chloroflexota bacterium]
EHRTPLQKEVTICLANLETSVTARLLWATFAKGVRHNPDQTLDILGTVSYVGMMKRPGATSTPDPNEVIAVPMHIYIKIWVDSGHHRLTLGDETKASNPLYAEDFNIGRENNNQFLAQIDIPVPVLPAASPNVYPIFVDGNQIGEVPLYVAVL